MPTDDQAGRAGAPTFKTLARAAIVLLFGIVEVCALMAFAAWLGMWPLCHCR